MFNKDLKSTVQKRIVFIATNPKEFTVCNHGCNPWKYSKKPYPQYPKNMCKTLLKNTDFAAKKQLKNGTFATIRKLWKITKF
jgi:hypothetical protein